METIRVKGHTRKLKGGKVVKVKGHSREIPSLKRKYRRHGVSRGALGWISPKAKRPLHRQMQY